MVSKINNEAVEFAKGKIQLPIHKVYVYVAVFYDMNIQNATWFFATM